jgi:transglutaminase-like putative cysteine protease
MFTLKRGLELVFLGLVYLSAVLLGFSQGNWKLATISIIGGTLAWVLVDWLNLVRMPRWLANVLSIGVLALTMRDFFINESSLQLLAVANLLVYLQSILLFQEKSPRQYWQLSVLNLLQVVVATIFTLEFEGGFLFLVYMTFAGVMLMLITLETEALGTGEEFSMRSLLQKRRRGNSADQATRPQLKFNPPERLVQRLPEMLGYLFGWALISVCFSCVLFVLVPRNQNAWFGPKYMAATATGLSKKMDLDPRGQLRIDTTMVFRVQFTDPVSKEPIAFSNPPYVRGMALGDWSVENNVTSWTAPYDRLDRFGFETLPKVEQERRAWYETEYTIEPTGDPLLYACLPGFVPNGEPDVIDYSLELAALSRKRDVQRIEQSPFKYKLWVPRPARGGLPTSFPYSSGATAKSALTLAGNPNERNWLLRHDPSRYPRIVQIATEIADRVGRENPLELARALEEHFVQSDEYIYTMDFTRVPRQPLIDPIEDFVANHKMGHCEMYASALALMLRSQGIPARVVVGFCGGSYNNWTYCYTYSNEHAHAWVEAYIPPEKCTSEMYADEAAGPGGAWLSLDPTPPASLRRGRNRNGNQALEIARTMWQDYVLGMDAETQESFGGSGGVLSLLRLDTISNTLQQGFAEVQQSPTLRLGVSGLILLFLLSIAIAPLLRKKKKKQKGGGSVGLFRRLVGRAIGFISPRFGKWLITGENSGPVIPFYQRVTAALSGRGLERQAGETHHEFLTRAIASCNDSLNGQAAKLNEPSTPEQLLAPIDSAFHAVRYGAASLATQDLQQLESNVQRFEQFLANLPPASSNSPDTIRKP